MPPGDQTCTVPQQHGMLRLRQCLPRKRAAKPPQSSEIFGTPLLRRTPWRERRGAGPGRLASNESSQWHSTENEATSQPKRRKANLANMNKIPRDSDARLANGGDKNLDYVYLVCKLKRLVGRRLMPSEASAGVRARRSSPLCARALQKPGSREPFTGSRARAAGAASSSARP